MPRFCWQIKWTAAEVFAHELFCKIVTIIRRIVMSLSVRYRYFCSNDSTMLRK